MVDKLVKDLLTMLGNRISIRVYDPPELDLAGTKEKQEGVPVLLEHNSFVSAFQGICPILWHASIWRHRSHPICCFLFHFAVRDNVRRFGSRYGDRKSGACNAQGKERSSGELQEICACFYRCRRWFDDNGTAGRFFLYERYRSHSDRESFDRFFLGQTCDRFLQIMPRENVSAMFYFFGFTLGVGVIINSTGIVINIINLIRRKEYGEAFFSKTGLAGALLFWWAIVMVVRIILGNKLGIVDVAGIGLPLLAIIFAEPIKSFIDKTCGKPHTEEASNWLIGGIIELLDIVSYFASNTFSFLRVGAFALAHAVLSFVIFTMGSLVSGKSASGLALEIIVFLFGNAVIIVLEGLIVTIQVIRLQYYEFFSKFFTRTGEPFKPVSFAGKV